MSLIQTIELRIGGSGALIEAELVNLSNKHVDDYEQHWQPCLQGFSQDDQDLSWRFKKQLATRQANHEGYAVEYDGMTQGMMLIETQYHWSMFTPGQRLVYIETVVSAPWNRIYIQRPPRIKGVGRELLEFARQRSRALGYNGCIGLHSLPGAVQFYERLGMMHLELEPEEILDADEDVPYFEYMGQPQEQENRDE